HQFMAATPPQFSFSLDIANASSTSLDELAAASDNASFAPAMSGSPSALSLQQTMAATSPRFGFSADVTETSSALASQLSAASDDVAAFAPTMSLSTKPSITPEPSSWLPSSASMALPGMDSASDHLATTTADIRASVRVDTPSSTQSPLAASATAPLVQ